MSSTGQSNCRSIEKAKRDTARKLIARTEMDDAMIAEIAGLPIDEVVRLRAESRH
ncbi:hypothetical protein HOP52_19030 [Halomonas campisalis]|uniref:DUF1127 domain-containing protein n=1 Tax=Billgrantia campisalis TaxID=74661 RepID=A0ABS9PDN6_9GAMM|nr:hypothetical protein [Halomonas campisalis]MCG6659841.1 hypothetical protein [Halomonas campisalis]MDR5865053.1 hypothetical protein [Halomonas campisalis]